MHIGFILDGNRRWAKKRGMPAGFGHHQGIQNFEKILDYVAKHDRIKTVSAFALSTENLQRSAEELSNLFKLFLTLEKNIPKLIKSQTRVRFPGDILLLPQDLKESFVRIENATSHCNDRFLNICVAYGGKDEIVRAVRQAFQSDNRISEDMIEKCLDTAATGQVDLIIRTGGKKRLSNFLLWQGAYAELYFTDILWPDFSSEELEKAIAFFDEQQRNFGK